MKRRYGCLGLLSLIGAAGLYTGERSLAPFLAFALFFEYFFVEADEFFVENLRKAASWAFYGDLLVSTAVACVGILTGQGTNALAEGICLGFGVGLFVFCFATAWFEWKEYRGLSDD